MATATPNKTKLKPIKPLLLRKKDVVRTLDSEENQVISNKLNKFIDEMLVSRAYHFIYSKLRAEVNNYRGAAKKVFREKKIHKVGDIYQQDTNVGTIEVYGTHSISQKTEFIMKAMENLGLQLDLDILVGDAKYKLDVNTDGMKLEKEFTEISTMLLEQYEEFQKEIKTDTCGDLSIDNAVKFVASRSAFVREIRDEACKYTPMYSKIKKTFMKASGVDGTFPRVYQYRGVTLSWVEVRDIASVVQQVKAFIENLELQTGIPYRQKLDMEIIQINVNNENVKLQIKLDGVDYLSMEFE